MRGTYTLACRGPDGALRWSERADNVICTEGKNAVLDAALEGSGYTAACYLGLIAATGYSAVSADDTAATHAGWLEAGDANGPACSSGRALADWLAAAEGAKTLSADAQFTMTGDGDVRGVFLVLGTGASGTIDDTGGALWSAAGFSSGAKSVQSGDTLTVFYQVRTDAAVAELTLTGVLPPPTQYTPYSASLSASGGEPPYQWTATGLPDGLTIGLYDGVVSGTPSTATVYSTTITVTDSADATAQLTQSITVLGQYSDGTDFGFRSSGINVVRSFNFPDLGRSTYGLARQNMPNYGYDPATYAGAPPDTTTNKVDPVIDSSMGLPAVKFTQPTRSGSNATGRWFINFSDDLLTRFDGDDPNNNEFYLQIRCRFSEAFFRPIMYQGYTPGSTQCTAGVNNHLTAMKILDIDMQDYPPATRNDTNTHIELILGTFEQRRTWAWYQSSLHQDLYTGGQNYNDEVVVYDPYERYTWGSGVARSDSIVQTGMYRPDGVTHSARYNFLHTPGDGGNFNGHTGGPGTTDPGEGIAWYPNEWMTFQVHVKLGPSSQVAGQSLKWTNCQFRVWQARQDQASILVHDLTRDWIAGPEGGGTPPYDCKFGKLWLGPYMTCKDPYQEHEPFDLWFAEFILSHAPIPDPGVNTMPVESVTDPFAAITSGKIRDLGSLTTYGYDMKLEYGSLVHDVRRRQMLMFGGGHTGSHDDSTLTFNCSSGAFPPTFLYPSTTEAYMQSHTLGGAGTYFADDALHNRWLQYGNHAAIHPFLGAVVVGDRYYVFSNGGARYADGTGMSSHGFGNCYLDLVTHQWRWLDEATPPITMNGVMLDNQPWYYCVSATLDPVSGKILLVGSSTASLGSCHLWVYDPATNTVIHTSTTGFQNINSTYSPMVVYVPSMDKFICIQPTYTGNPAKVWELTFNRTAPYNSTVDSTFTPTGTPPPLSGGSNKPTRFEYDPDSGLIVCGVVNGYVSLYDPVARAWSGRQLYDESSVISTMTMEYGLLARDAQFGWFACISSTPSYHLYIFRP